MKRKSSLHLAFGSPLKYSPKHYMHHDRSIGIAPSCIVWRTVLQTKYPAVLQRYHLLFNLKSEFFLDAVHLILFSHPFNLECRCNNSTVRIMDFRDLLWISVKENWKIRQLLINYANVWVEPLKMFMNVFPLPSLCKFVPLSQKL